MSKPCDCYALLEMTKRIIYSSRIWNTKFVKTNTVRAKVTRLARVGVRLLGTFWVENWVPSATAAVEMETQKVSLHYWIANYYMCATGGSFSFYMPFTFRKIKGSKRLLFPFNLWVKPFRFSNLKNYFFLLSSFYF